MSDNYVVSFNKELKKILKFLNTIIEKEDNKNLINLINENNNNTEYLLDFWNNINSKSNLLCEHNEFLFCQENEILSNKLSIYEYYNNQNMNDISKQKLWEHLEFMYLYTYSFKSNIDELNGVLNNINDELENKENDVNLKSWLAIVDNIKNNKNRIEKYDDNDNDNEENNGFNIPNLNLPKINREMFDKFEKYSDEITNGPIGKLAKDIANNLDLEKMNNPMELLTSLCSGDLKNNNLMSLINSVGSELQDKINNNEINQEELMKDASNIMGNFSGLFNENNVPNVPKNPETHNKTKKQKTRERLLRKLEEKKNKNNNI